MSDPIDTPREPESFADLPIQPTGSGVADLEIAYEQMKLAEAVDGSVGAEAFDGSTSMATDPVIPTDDDPAARESAAHPS